jgi:hypothetical protein
MDESEIVPLPYFWPMLRLLSLLLSLAPFVALSQSGTPMLSERSHVSLITCGPGEELYEAFGHTAILVYDPALEIDYVYNYGTFDFNQPNFYLNFTRGNLLYQLSVSRFGRFINSYRHQNRSVREQVLNLSREQRQAIFEKLEWNALDENKRYYYDYFFDNCSTRPRDLIEQALGGIITYDSAHVEMPRKTIRQLVDRCIIKKLPWGDLGIDICLGQPIDRAATAREYMYLPDELEKAFDHASIRTADGMLPLVQEKFIHFEAVPIPMDKSWFAPQPLFVGILLFFSVILTFMKVWGWNVRWMEGTAFLLFGLLGWSLLLLWFGTNHTAAANNWNLLWAMPLHLFFGIILFRTVRPKWVGWYALMTILLCLAILLAWDFLPQLLHYSLKFIVVLQLFLAVGIFREERLSNSRNT